MSVFTDKDYNSNDGMMTSVWGPPMWHVLHTISFNYPIKPTIEQKNQYQIYFKSIENILPCKTCRENLHETLKESPLNKRVFKNRETLSRWVYELHETVNGLLGKSSNLTYNEVRDRFENFRSRCISNKAVRTEKGCVEPLYGVKSKCVLNIIPKNSRSKTLKIDPKCILKKK